MMSYLEIKTKKILTKCDVCDIIAGVRKEKGLC